MARQGQGIYDDLLNDLNLKAEDVPLLAGEMVNADQRGQCAGMNSIIDELPKSISTAHVISSKGCTAVPRNNCISIRPVTGNSGRVTACRCSRCWAISSRTPK